MLPLAGSCGYGIGRGGKLPALSFGFVAQLASETVDERLSLAVRLQGVRMKRTVL